MRCILKILMLIYGIMAGSLWVCADELKVKSFGITMEPMTVPMQRTDLNGNVCALVKVIVPEARAAFEGNLIGETDYKTSEYWCYLTPGTKMLKVKYPGCEPLMVNFVDIMGAPLQEKRIYELVLQVPEKIHNTDIFDIQGKVIVTELDGDNKVTKFRDFEKIVNGIKVYLNYRGGKYDKILSITDKNYASASWVSGVYEISYNFEGVKFGDSITVIPSDLRYKRQTKVITPKGLGAGNMDFKLSRARKTGRYILEDGDTHEPLAGVSIFDGDKLRYSSFWSSDTTGVAPLAVTDAQGRFELPLVAGVEKTFIIGAVPGISTGTTARTMHTTGTFYVYRRRNYFKVSLDKDEQQDNVVVETPDGNKHLRFSKYDNELSISYPEGFEPDYIMVRRPGYKTAKIDRENLMKNHYSPLKMKKGNENDIIEYIYIDRKWKERHK